MNVCSPLASTHHGAPPLKAAYGTPPVIGTKAHSPQQQHVIVHPYSSRAVRMQTTRPKLSDEQKAQLKTCFELMDADGSGAIDADELMDAFELLGLNFTRADVQVCLCSCFCCSAPDVAPRSWICHHRLIMRLVTRARRPQRG